MADRVRVAIVFGGPSAEHDVSVKSATEIAANIDLRRYDPVYVGITRAGAWMLCDGPAPGWEAVPGTPAVISPDRAAHGLLVVDDGTLRTTRLDVVFPVLHGATGEDGAIQGLLELAGIPYVGCGIASSAICMDKSLAYTVARGAGIDTPAHRVVDEGEIPVADDLVYPVFVKPARSGSSFGVTKVERPDLLASAVATARGFDTKVLIEQAVAGAEVGCAVLGRGTALFVGEVDRIDLTHGFFRIHQEDRPEQGSANAVLTVPADLPVTTRDEIRATAKRIYTALGCEGLARVDMFLQEDGHLVLNEVNTLPGFTAYSRYPRMMAAAGVTLTEVIDRLLRAATEGHP